MLGMLGLMNLVKGDPLVGGLMMLFDNMESSRRIEEKKLEIQVRQEQIRIKKEIIQYRNDVARDLSIWAFGRVILDHEQSEMIPLWNKYHGNVCHLPESMDLDDALFIIGQRYLNIRDVTKEAEYIWGDSTSL